MTTAAQPDFHRLMDKISETNLSNADRTFLCDMVRLHASMQAEIAELRTAYATGMTASDFQRVQQWIADGMPKTPETAFTAGPARQAARLCKEAVSAQQAEIERLKGLLGRAPL